MQVAINIIAWSLVGAILGFGLICGGFEAYYHVFEPVAANDANEIRAWQDFIAMMAGGLGALAGFIAGLVFGFVRRKPTGQSGIK